MGTSEGSTGNETRATETRAGDQNASASTRESLTNSTATIETTTEQQTEFKAEGTGVSWRIWWSQFKSEFSVAGPTKQVSQIYYISGTLAVIGSLIVGMLTLGGDFFSGKSVLPHPTTEPTDASIVARKLSIAVLPFTNLSGDTSQEYFADGITDSLTTDLSRSLPGSFVVARGTAFTYKGKTLDVRQIGRDLHVRYVLEGSTLLEGDQVRVNARLADAQMGNEIWAERFDTTRGGVLQVQDEIVGRLSRSIGLEVINFAAKRSEREPKSAEATDFVLRGQAILNRPSSPANMIAARDLFERALKLQADNVDALAGVASTYILEVINGYYPNDTEVRLERAEPLLARALALDDRDVVALKANTALLRARGRFDDAIAAGQILIKQNPGDPWAYKDVGLSMMYLGRTADALDWFQKAEQLGPRDPGRWTWLGGKGQAFLLLGRDAEAIASLRAAVESNPADVSDYAVLAAAYALAGHNDEARAALAEYSRSYPDTTVASFRNLSPVPLRLTDPNYRQQRERLKDGLRRAGMPEEVQ
jgi:TolB-like protein/tetratricopeptide (TPR) repeat protein